MPLSDFEAVKTPIIYKGKILVEVRGLNLDDVTLLVRNHLADFQMLWKLYDPVNQKLLPNSADGIDQMIFGLLSNAPETAAKLIAIASDEPGETDKARRLPMPLQMKILIEVVKLTFEDVGGPLEFVGMLGRVLTAELPAS